MLRLDLAIFIVIQVFLKKANKEPGLNEATPLQVILAR
jgi:hypothetical protein